MVMPLGRGNETMFTPSPFNPKDFTERCKQKYNILPRPHWVTTHYGGHVGFSPLLIYFIMSTKTFMDITIIWLNYIFASRVSTFKIAGYRFNAS